MMLTCLLCAACSDPAPAAKLTTGDASTEPSDTTLDPADTANDVEVPEIAAETLSETAPETAPDSAPGETARAGCKVSADCPGLKDLCILGACQAQTTCASDKQCQPAGLVCDTAGGVCVECLSVDDCTLGSQCKAHKCIPPATNCASTKDCELGYVCDKGTKLCVECVGPADCTKGLSCVETICLPMFCEPGSAKCADPATSLVCKADGSGYDSTPCPAQNVCIEGKCANKVCEPNQPYCSGNQPMLCDATGTTSTKLDACLPGEVCLAGKCATAACTAGQKQCADAATVALCNANGSGYEKTPCTLGSTCVAGACIQVVCAANLATCQGTQKGICDATGTVLTLTEDCAASGKVCTAGACTAAIVCPAGAKSCSGDKLKTCKPDGSGFDEVSCDDANACTADSCDATKGCANAAVGDGAACDLDGTKCTADSCKAATCAQGSTVGCDDKNPCTTDSCNAGTGACLFAKAADGAVCDDGDACTVGDACALGACQGAAKTCGAGESCVAGACKAAPPAGMVLIPGGSFKMGCVAGDAACSSGEKPQHVVALDAYYLDATEVTAAKYKACVAAGGCTGPEVGNSCTPSQFGTYGAAGKENHPINCVVRDQAVEYCKWAGRRLPTEAEWERAARTGADGKVYPWGDAWPPPNGAGNYSDSSAANWSSYLIAGYSDGFSATAPVGSFAKNTYGLFDLGGNVSEWVSDWAANDYYAMSPASNPQGPSIGIYSVFRDSGFSGYAAVDIRISKRNSVGLSESAHSIGFRCAKSLP